MIAYIPVGLMIALGALAGLLLIFIGVAAYWYAAKADAER